MAMTISSLLQAYKNNTLTPRQLLQEIEQNCDRYADKNIWIHRLTAAELEPYLARLEQSSVDSLPLYGIPFAIKDNIDLAGIPTTAGCKEFAYVPERSAFVVQQLIDAGAIPIGKTNLDQFATGLVGVRSPEPWGPCHNAFDDDYISGGSSAGSAVSVSLGLVSFSLGTDTAGSGRVPASHNNLIGLKASRGLLSTSGVVPACRSLDCVTVFAHTVDDTNLVYQQAAVYDPADDYARPNHYDNTSRHYGRHAGAFTFAVPQTDQLKFFGNNAAETLFHQSVEKLEAMGGTKQIIDFAPFTEAARLLYEGPWTAERYVAIEEIISKQPEALLPVINTIIGSAEGKSAIDTFKAMYQLQHCHQQVHAVLSLCDFLVTPTVGTVYTIDEVEKDPITLNSNNGYYTNFMNLLDCAGIAVPAGFLDNGLPWGISLVAPAFHDIKLLAFASRWQQHLGLKTGSSDSLMETTTLPAYQDRDTISVVVCGAHMQGLPLNWQLSERGATLIEATETADKYRLYALAGNAPKRPGLRRDENNGVAIEVEVWQLPREEFGSFVADIPAPLGIGKIELMDGRVLPGFTCEGYAFDTAEEITELKGWRGYIAKTK